MFTKSGSISVFPQSYTGDYVYDKLVMLVLNWMPYVSLACLGACCTH